MNARIHHAIILVVGLVATPSTVFGQITWIKGDSVLNAPYRGTVNSLRDAMQDISYGEVQTYVEPSGNSPFDNIPADPLVIWHDPSPGSGEPWDRSVLRLYNGIDASGSEIDLTGHDSQANGIVLPYESFKRLTYKVIGTKTLVTRRFKVRIHSHYAGGPHDLQKNIDVAPATGSFDSSPGLSEAFHYGTKVLDVSVGAAQLSVPLGQTVNMIGAAYLWPRKDIGPSTIDVYDVLLPGAAESVWVQNSDQFAVGTFPYSKATWGTPWAGYLRGFYCRDDGASPTDERWDLFGPDGTHYDSAEPTLSSEVTRNFDHIRPMRLGMGHPATIVRSYSGDNVISIADNAGNAITIDRPLPPADYVVISTSDGRSWRIYFDANAQITGVVPGSSKGARYFSWNAALDSGGRVTEVRTNPTPGSGVLYKFVYYTAGPDIGDIKEEWRLVDGQLEKAVEHVIDGNFHRQRIDHFGQGAGDYRVTDFNYDTSSSPLLANRLASVTTHSEAGGTGTTFTSTYTHDINNSAGSMVITHVDLPDGTDIDYQYDAQVGTPQNVNFGLRTKTIHSGPGGALTTYDASYEFFYSSGTKLFYLPRLVKQRDGRGAESEITYDYENGNQDENGDGLSGEIANQLLAVSGPTINRGTSGTRIPHTRFTFSPTEKIIRKQEVEFASGQYRSTSFAFDSLRRPTVVTIDSNGLSLATRTFYCDGAINQARTTVDADGYVSKTYFDTDGRMSATRAFLTAAPGWANACTDPPGNYYETSRSYDNNGYLDTETVDNKDQTGGTLTPGTIVTDYTPDALGRITSRVIGGVNQEFHTVYNWLNEVVSEYDTSIRGRKAAYDGRGLVSSEMPLAGNQSGDDGLKTSYVYDEMARLTLTYPPTHRADTGGPGPFEERTYDDFGRLEQVIRHPGADGGNLVTTSYEYDAASHVTRTVVDEAGAGVLSDATDKFDEGGFNYESRRRFTANIDDDTKDPVTRRQFDWAGLVKEIRSLGDATVGDSFTTNEYDVAGRLQRVTDSEGGETLYSIRDGRGNLKQQKILLAPSVYAFTDFEYDALGRLTKTTDPEDHANQRNYTTRDYDSRGNVRRQSAFPQVGAAVQTQTFAYDNASRQTHAAVLADPSAATTAEQASVSSDRVVRTIYDSDGRVQFRKTYNNNAATELTTSTTYDTVGRIDRVTDPGANYVDDDYLPNGRLQQRAVSDGAGTRVFQPGFDGLDRTTLWRAAGTPNLDTGYVYDGLDRQVSFIDRNTIARETQYDLIGRVASVFEDAGGPLQRFISFEYNRLSQQLTRTASNNSSSAPGNQTTTYRYDTLGRQTRVVYPDAVASEHSNPAACTDCMRLTYDPAGRLSQRQDQRNTIVNAFDKRGLLQTRTAGTVQEKFEFDALGRLRMAERGTAANEDAVSKSVLQYTTLGDLDYEDQAIAESAARRIDSAYDQAGDRTQLVYPNGATLAFAPTVLDQVNTISLNGSLLVDYNYVGNTGTLLDTRTVITSAGKTYQEDSGYDGHHRKNAQTNRVNTGGGYQTVAAYTFTHDNNGNPLSQNVITGLPDFLGDDRLFAVDRLNRLTDAVYVGSGEVESTDFDLQGNRIRHDDRTGAVHQYALANRSNEYSTIDGAAVHYDGTGNLSRDEAGNGYNYDEQNRLSRICVDSNGNVDPAGNAVCDANETLLATYTYDALGRQISFRDAVANATVRYYYDGQAVIEERDGACPGAGCESLLRYHVNGAQYIDERVASFDLVGLRANEFTYYLLGDNYSVAATADASGSVIERLDYGVSGDLASTPAGHFFDADNDGDIDLTDWSRAGNGGATCLTGPADYADEECLVHDFDGDGDVDLRDLTRLQLFFRGAGVPAPLVSSRTGNYAHDADGDRDVDIDDYSYSFVPCQDTPTEPRCLAIHDWTTLGASDGIIGFNDFGGFMHCAQNLDGGLPPDDCYRTVGGVKPTSGSFALHGAMINVLDADGPGGLAEPLALQNNRARYFDLKNGRWLQRDRAGYADGSNLYEAFGANPLRFRDALGHQSDNEPGMLDTFLNALSRIGSGQDPFTGEGLVDRAFRISGEQNSTSPGFNLTPLDVAELRTAGAINAAEPVVARVTGGLQVVGGAIETGTGIVIVIGSDGFGAAPGMIFTLHGADVVQAGLQQVASGEFTPTFTFETIGNAGFPNIAFVVDTGISLGGSLGAVAVADELASTSTRLISTASARGLRTMDSLTLGRQRIMAVVFNAESGDYVLGSGFSPGNSPNRLPARLFDIEPTPGAGWVRYGELDELGRPTGVRAFITPDMIGSGTTVPGSLRPPGFVPAQGLARAHLLAAELGGSGTDPRNVVALLHRPANTPTMRKFELLTRSAAEHSGAVLYESTPIYRGAEFLPLGVTLKAEGMNSPFRLYVTVRNSK